MNAHWVLTCALLIRVGATVSAVEPVLLLPGVSVRPATVAQGQAILQSDDRFTSRLSRFDIESRVGRQGATREDFNALVKAQVRPWPEDHWTKVQAALAQVSQWLNDRQLSPPFPQEIFVVYTTGNEEGNAAYCRGASIVLPATVVGKARPQRLNNLMAHELFHILSANHPKLQEALYASIGFQRLPQEVLLPDSLKHRKITNPDGPALHHYIALKHEGEEVAAVPLLFASVDRFDPERGKSFFDFLNFQLLILERSTDGWKPAAREGQPVMIAPKSNETFFQQIGRNTGYIYHPDEILADNFVFLLQNKKDLKSPQVVEKMRETIAAFGK